MPVKIESEEVVKDVVFLTNAEVEFVSLVRHGANQMPFRVVKEDSVSKGGIGSGHHGHDGRSGGGSVPYEGSRQYNRDGGAVGGKERSKGGENKVAMIVQSILLPKSVELEKLSKEDKLNWLAEARVDSMKEFDDYRSLEQLPVEKFEKGSLSMVKLHDSGAWAIVGALSDKSEVKNVLTVGKAQAEKLMSIPESPMNAVVAETPMPAYSVTFGEMFDKELSSFIDVVRGSLSQTGSDSKKRKSAVLNALDAFRSFLSMSLDLVNGESAKVAKTSSGLGSTEMERQLKELTETVRSLTKTAGGSEDMFKTPEEFETAVKGLVTPMIEEIKALLPKKEEKPAEKIEKPDTEAMLAPVLAEMAKVTDAVKGIAAKQEALETQLVGKPSGEEPEPDPKKVEKKEKSVFSGLLLKK